MKFEEIKPINSQGEEDDALSPEEIEAAYKDVHMTGRAMRVGETPKDYKREREESWERMKREKAEKDDALSPEEIEAANKEQAEKDECEIERIRREIASYSEQKRESSNDIESYKDLANVKLCEEKLKSLLKKYHSDGNFSSKSAQQMIYKMLTQRSEFVQNTEGAGKNVNDLMQNYKPQMQWYRNAREALEKTIDSSSEFKCDSNPAWFGVNTRPEVSRREDINIKAYTTIPTADYAFIQHVPELAKELRQLTLESDDIIKVKIPNTLSGFIANNDSIVVHFKKKENKDRILEILNTWMQVNSIHKSPREMGRTEIAADSKDDSFSNLVAKNMANWLEQNAGKYDDDLLAGEAIKYAIKQSQESPI